jgi:hypothetical protein
MADGDNDNLSVSDRNMNDSDRTSSVIDNNASGNPCNKNDRDRNSLCSHDNRSGRDDNSSVGHSIVTVGDRRSSVIAATCPYTDR